MNDQRSKHLIAPGPQPFYGIDTQLIYLGKIVEHDVGEFPARTVEIVRRLRQCTFHFAQ